MNIQIKFMASRQRRERTKSPEAKASIRYNERLRQTQRYLMISSKERDGEKRNYRENPNF